MSRYDDWLMSGDPGQDDPGADCFVRECEAAALWHVETTGGPARERDACELHLPQAVERLIKRSSAPVVVHPMFDVEHASQLAGLVAIGAAVYGLVTNPDGAAAVAAMGAELAESVRAIIAGGGE